MNQRPVFRVTRVILMLLLFPATIPFSSICTADETQPRGAIGIMLSPNDTGGALILSVTPGTPAAMARLQSGDRILTIDSTTVKGHEDVIRLIGSAKPGSNIHLDIDRQGLQGSMWAIVGNKADVDRAMKENASQVIPSVIRAQRFELVTEDGTLLATIGQVRGNGNFAIFDQAGKLQFMVAGTKNGGIMAVANGKTNLVRVGASAAGGNIEILDAAGQDGVTLNAQSDYGFSRRFDTVGKSDWPSFPQ